MTRHAIITGAGGGIGRATAQALAQEGLELSLMGRRPEPLRETVEALGETAPAVRTALADFRDREAMDRALDELVPEGKRLDVVVLNAGISTWTAAETRELGAFQEVLEVDLVAPLRLLRRLIPHLNEDGRVVFVSSVLSKVGVAGLHGYCAAKAGLNGVARAMALELAPKRITVNALCPSWVETPMTASNIAAQAPQMGLTGESARAAFMADLPLKRFLSADEIAAWIAWLSSPAAGGMTGQAVAVCLGSLATTQS